MKRLPPYQIIAEYRAAWLAFYGYPAPQWEYVGGWFRKKFGPEDRERLRGAQLIYMTAQLNERAKAKG